MADWRVEADDEWLAAHSSDTFGRLRRALRRSGLAGTLGEAVSQAELGPFAGAPRNPRLRTESKGYSTVRPAEREYQHTVVQADPDVCRRCGSPAATAQRITRVDGDGAREVLATVRLCVACQVATDSPMPATRRARERARRVVL